MDFGKALSFVFQDKDWLRKIGMASLITFIGMLCLILPGAIFLSGYMVTLARNVKDGVEHPLPGTDDWGSIFSEGARVFGIMIVYNLPLILLSCVLGGSGAFLQSMSEDGGGVGSVLVLINNCLSLPLGLLTGLMMMAALVRYIQFGEMSAAMNFGATWQLLRSNIADFFLVILMSIVVQVIALLVVSVSAVTICGPFVLIIPAFVWRQSVMGYLLGQIAGRDAMSNKEKMYGDEF